tara:strand:- start:470 stop:730 length:261 start_codon:yes stop_codon:yes gene_type:complete
LTIATIQHFHSLAMIKTLFASACVLACCMGNEYPAKADCSGFGYQSRAYYQCQDNEFNQYIEQGNIQREMDQRLDRIESDAWRSSY